MKEVAFVLKKMDGKLPELFGMLPRMPYGIRPVPDYIAPKHDDRLLLGPAGRRLAGRLLLREHLRPEEPAAVRTRSAVAARGGARPPLANCALSRS